MVWVTNDVWKTIDPFSTVRTGRAPTGVRVGDETVATSPTRAANLLPRVEPALRCVDRARLERAVSLAGRLRHPLRSCRCVRLAVPAADRRWTRARGALGSCRAHGR